jgi:hypothetical protein
MAGAQDALLLGKGNTGSALLCQLRPTEIASGQMFNRDTRLHARTTTEFILRA